MKKYFLLISICALSMYFTACAQPNNHLSPQAIPSVQVQETEAVVQSNMEQSEETEEDSIPSDELTPYQLLVLGAGNAEDLTIKYTVSFDSDTFSGAVYKRGDMLAAVYTAENMYGDELQIREVENGSDVFYVIDDYKKAVRYNAPADDILLYRMIDTVSEESETVEESVDGVVVYSYSRPFVHDDGITEDYRFYMVDGSLESLEVYFDGALTATYDFQVFSQVKPDDALYDIPVSYELVSFDYSYDGGTMPPWWEP